MISAERMKSVRMAPFTCSFSSSCGSPIASSQLFFMVVVVKDLLEDLLGRFEGEIGAADHQQRRDQERRECRQQKRRRQQDQDLVLEAAPGDLADDRQLALRRETDDIARRDRGIVDDYAGRLGARLARRRADVVERGRGELGDGGDIVEEGDQSGRHRAAVRRTCPCDAIRALAAPMLGLDFIRDNRATVETGDPRQGRRRSISTRCSRSTPRCAHLKTEIDRLRAERNAISAKFKDAAPEEKAELGRQAKEAGAKASELEKRARRQGSGA